jgi:hypothetical protein
VKAIHLQEVRHPVQVVVQVADRHPVPAGVQAEVRHPVQVVVHLPVQAGVPLADIDKQPLTIKKKTSFLGCKRQQD